MNLTIETMNLSNIKLDSQFQECELSDTSILPLDNKANNELMERSFMIHEKLQLSTKSADGYIIPLRSIKLVNVITDKGMVGCGAFDLWTLDAYGIPVAKVKAEHGEVIDNIDDLMQGIVREVNQTGQKVGLRVGMTGREALEHL
ncbi:MAG: YunC family protein [Methanotrichaceae archaeon]|nr:YunC family protein [Methanotrichaceae archaeon]